METKKIIEEIADSMPDSMLDSLPSIVLDKKTVMYLFEYSKNYPYKNIHEAVNHLIREGIRAQEKMKYLV
jgi:uncharacterized protein YbaA (DUF1428 family)